MSSRFDVCIGTNENDIPVKYGMYSLCEEREAARSSLKYIFTDMTDIKKGYFRLGFHLNEFHKNKYYEDFGYLTFEEFCEANFEMDKGAVSRCINVFLMTTAYGEEHHSAGVRSVGCASQMSDKYKDYSYSQLTEMLPLSEEQREKVDPGMTVKQIRELKSKIMDITPQQVIAFVEYFKNKVKPFTRENLLKELEEHGKTYQGYVGGDINYDFKPGKVRIHYSDYYKLNKILDYYVESGGTFENEEVATSQPEEKEIHYDSFQDESFIADLLMECYIFVIREGIKAGLSIISSDMSGKRFSFQDADGNHYNIQYSVTKKKN